MTALDMESISIPVARCRLYTFLAALLRYPEQALVDTLNTPAARETLQYAAEELEPFGGSIRTHIETLCSLGKDVSLQQLEKQYLAVFGSSPRGRVAAYECEYGNREIFQFASELADIAAFYNAFGLKTRTGDRADHVAAECEFVGVLCAKEFTVLANHDTDERLEIVRAAQAKFLREHLCQWAPAFAQQLNASDAGGFYGSVAGLLDAVVVREANGLDINCGPAYLPLRAVPGADDPSNCMSCGKQEGLPGAEDLQE
jgi:putative dimethyl sulfoxide reductase chaperone